MKRGHFSQALLLALVAVLLGLGVLWALSRNCPCVSPMEYDSGVFAYIGRELVQGKTPYVDAWDHKPPGVHLLNALAVWVGGPNRWSIWAMEYVVVFAAALLSFALLRRQFGFGPAICGSIAWLWAFVQLRPDNFTEEYSLLFSFAALWIFFSLLERPQSPVLHAGLGLTAGLSFLLRPTNIGPQVSILFAGVALWLAKERTWVSTKGLAAFGLGFAAPVIVTGGFFAARGALQPYIEAAYVYNIYYSVEGDEGHRMDVFGTLYTGLQLLWPVMLVAVPGILVELDKTLHRLRKKTVSPVALWLTFDFALEWLLASLTGNNYRHYYMNWLPWTSVAVAAFIGGSLPGISLWVHRARAPLLIAGVVLVARLSWSTLRSQDLTRLYAQEEVVQYVLTNTEPRQAVLVWGDGTAINFITGRASPTAYFLYWNLVPSPLTDRFAAEFIDEIRADPPALILDREYLGSRALSYRVARTHYREGNRYVAPRMQEFLDFVHHNYEPSGVAGGVLVYRLTY